MNKMYDCRNFSSTGPFQVSNQTASRFQLSAGRQWHITNCYTRCIQSQMIRLFAPSHDKSVRFGLISIIVALCYAGSRRVGTSATNVEKSDGVVLLAADVDELSMHKPLVCVIQTTKRKTQLAITLLPLQCYTDFYPDEATFVSNSFHSLGLGSSIPDLINCNGVVKAGRTCAMPLGPEYWNG